MTPTASAAASAPRSWPAPAPSRRSWPATGPRPRGTRRTTPAPAEDDPGGPCRPATGAQVRALRALCCRDGVDLDALVAARAEADGPEGLTQAEAGRLIDELQRAPADAPA